MQFLECIYRKQNFCERTPIRRVAGDAEVLTWRSAARWLGFVLPGPGARLRAMEGVSGVQPLAAASLAGAVKRVASSRNSAPASPCQALPCMQASVRGIWSASRCSVAAV